MTKRCCGTCNWIFFTMPEQQRPRSVRDACALCLFPTERILAMLPWAARRTHISLLYVRPSEGDTCPTWEP
jgi:hypothetical protein